MINTVSPYISFFRQLNLLLKQSGIAPSRLPVVAEQNREKNGFELSGAELSRRIGRVVIYMEEHLAGDLSLEKLAEEARLSKFQLIRYFRDEMGTTPWKSLIKMRIDKVKELLKQGIPLAQAAAETGFYDQSHLNKVFRAETGLTPGEYLELNFVNRN